MEVTAKDILWLVGFPAVLAVGAMLGTRPWRRGRDLGGWGAAIAVAGGFAIAFVHVYSGVPRFPPQAAQEWLFFYGAAPVALALGHVFVAGRMFWVVAGTLALAAVPWLVLYRVSALPPERAWTWGTGAMWAVALWWWAMEALAERVRGGALPLLLAAWAAVVGLAIMNARSVTLGQVAGAITVPLAVVAIAGLWSRAAVLAGGGMLSLAVVLFGLLLCGHFFAELALRDLLLLAAAPLAAWAGELPGLGDDRSWRRVLARWVAVLIVLALPAFDAAVGLKETMAEQYEGYAY